MSPEFRDMKRKNSLLSPHPLYCSLKGMKGEGRKVRKDVWVDGGRVWVDGGGVWMESERVSVGGMKKKGKEKRRKERRTKGKK